jgi:hypothetical protein
MYNLKWVIHLGFEKQGDSPQKCTVQLEIVKFLRKKKVLGDKRPPLSNSCNRSNLGTPIRVSKTNGTYLKEKS